MQVFVGLGNPGAKHARQRHNIGFMAVDAIAEAHRFTPWRTKFQGEVSEGRFGSEKVLLIKPQTFMNLSGQSVGEAIRYLKVEPDQVWVFHDELDLAPGKLRVKTGGGHAGHNGLRSLHQHIGAEYHRVRLGIGHPGQKNKVSGYVLHEFAKADQDWLDPMIAAVAREAGRLAQGDSNGFMNAVALAIRPPKTLDAALDAAGQRDPSKKPNSRESEKDLVRIGKPIDKKISPVPDANGPDMRENDNATNETMLGKLLAKFSRN